MAIIQPGTFLPAVIVHSRGFASFSGTWEPMDRDRIRFDGGDNGYIRATGARKVEIGFNLSDFGGIDNLNDVTDRARSALRHFEGFPVSMTANGTEHIAWVANTGSVLTNTPDAGHVEIALALQDVSPPFPSGTNESNPLAISQIFSITSWERIDSDGFIQPREPLGFLRPSETGYTVDLPAEESDVEVRTPVEILEREFSVEVTDAQGNVLVEALESLVVAIRNGLGDGLDPGNLHATGAVLRINGVDYEVSRMIIIEGGTAIVEGRR